MELIAVVSVTAYFTLLLYITNSLAYSLIIYRRRDDKKILLG